MRRSTAALKSTALTTNGNRPKRLYSWLALGAVTILLLVCVGLFLYLPLRKAISLSLGVGVGIVIIMLVTYRQLQLIKRLDFGVQMLRAEEYSSRLAHVKDPGIDCAVDLFNLMMEHLKAQRLKLEEREFFLQKLLRVTPMGIITLDAQSRIETLNYAAQRMLQLSSKQGLGLQFSELPRAVDLGLHTLAENQSVVQRLDNRHIYRCGRYSFFHHGELRAFVVIEVLTDAILAAERTTYERVIRMCSHEVQNTTAGALSVIQSTADYLSTNRDAELYKRALEAVGGRFEELGAFMQRTAEVLKLPAPRLEWVNLQTFFNGQKWLTPSGFSHKQIELTIEAPEDPLYTRMDLGLLNRVMHNVIKNACESIESRGCVRVYLEAGNGLEIVIEDDGETLPPEGAGDLFTPFVTTKPNGQGLGLALCQEILQLHKFGYSLRTEKDGKTRFRIGLREVRSILPNR